MRTANKPRLAKLREEEVFTPAFDKVVDKAKAVSTLLALKLPPIDRPRFRDEIAALLHWVRTGAVTDGHNPKEFLRLLLDVLYLGKVPDASLNIVDADTPLTLVLAAGMARVHLEAREPVPTVQLAALGGTDRRYISFLIAHGELRRSQAARTSGRMIDAPIVPSDARRWLGWDVPGARAPEGESNELAPEKPVKPSREKKKAARG